MNIVVVCYLKVTSSYISSHGLHEWLQYILMVLSILDDWKAIQSPSQNMNFVTCVVYSVCAGTINFILQPLYRQCTFDSFSNINIYLSLQSYAPMFLCFTGKHFRYGIL